MFTLMVPVLYTSSVVPASGGFLLWSTKLIHPVAGIFSEMLFLLSAPIYMAYYAVLLGNYVTALFPSLYGKEVLVSAAAIIIMGLIASLGNYTFASINSIMVILLFIILSSIS